MAEFVHCVFFWLRTELTPDQRAAFASALRGLGESPNVGTCRVGTPALTPREVVDNSWDYQLLLTFADRAAHDAYQGDGDAVHQGFVRDWHESWTHVQVYDSIPAE